MKNELEEQLSVYKKRLLDRHLSSLESVKGRAVKRIVYDEEGLLAILFMDDTFILINYPGPGYYDLVSRYAPDVSEAEALGLLEINEAKEWREVALKLDASKKEQMEYSKFLELYKKYKHTLEKE